MTFWLTRANETPELPGAQLDWLTKYAVDYRYAGVSYVMTAAERVEFKELLNIAVSAIVALVHQRSSTTPADRLAGRRQTLVGNAARNAISSPVLKSARTRSHKETQYVHRILHRKAVPGPQVGILRGHRQVHHGPERQQRNL